MTKLDELIESNECFVGCYSLMLPIREQIKELAIAYAKVCLEKAAEEACLRCQGITTLEEWRQNIFKGTDGLQDIFVDVDKKSITNVELP